MEIDAELVLPKVRCAAVHDAADVDAAGTAPNWDAIAVVALPLPWPRDVGAMRPFADLAETVGATVTGADGRRWRPQAVVPDPADGTPEGAAVRVMAFERPPGPAAGPFGRREWLLAPGAIGDGVATRLLGALLAGDAAAVAAFDDRRDDSPEGTVDLLFCTHGTRDVCCGGTGAATYQDLVGLLGGERTSGVRLWRTSHTGGHRFAPTAVSLPDGTSWAHLSAQDAVTLVRREGSAAELGRHCRGSLGLDAAPTQVADREALAVFGWEWLTAERHAVVVAHERSTLATTVVVHGRWPHGAEASATVRVGLDHHIAMPTCGAVGEPELVTEPVWSATVLDSTGPDVTGLEVANRDQ